NPLRVFENPAASPVNVRAVLEDDVDKRIAEHRLSPHGLHSRGREKGRDNRIGNLIFDELRAPTRPFCKHDHLRVGEIGNRVKRDTKHCSYAHAVAKDTRSRTRKRLRALASMSRLIMADGSLSANFHGEP